MKVKELIELLQKADQEDEIKIYDSNSEQMESVTGMIFDGKDRIVELCSCDIN